MSTDTASGTNASTQMQTVDTRPFLLLVGQLAAVLIAAWVATVSDDIGNILVVFFIVLWLIFIINRSDLIAQWGGQLGFPQPNQKVVVQ